MRKRKVKRRFKKRIRIFEYKSKRMNQSFRFRSSWELKFAEYLENNENVIHYSYEKFAIKYISNNRTKKVRRYFQDFFFVTKDDLKIIVEIKPFSKLNDRTNVKKFIFAEEFCKQNDMIFMVLTEKGLKQLKIL